MACHTRSQIWIYWNLKWARGHILSRENRSETLSSWLGPPPRCPDCQDRNPSRCRGTRKYDRLRPIVMGWALTDERVPFPQFRYDVCGMMRRPRANLKVTHMITLNSNTVSPTIKTTWMGVQNKLVQAPLSNRWQQHKAG